MLDLILKEPLLKRSITQICTYWTERTPGTDNVALLRDSIMVDQILTNNIERLGETHYLKKCQKGRVLKARSRMVETLLYIRYIRIDFLLLHYGLLTLFSQLICRIGYDSVEA